MTVLRATYPSLLLTALAMLATMTVLSSTPASAQTVSGERFRPATTSAGVIDVESAAVAEHLSWNGALWTGYAYDPLVVYQGGERLGALVGHRVGANAVFSIGLFDWVELAVDMPIIVYQVADQGSLDPAVTNGLSAFGLGDMRLAPKIRLLRASEQLVDLALIPALTVPTGSPSGQSFTGEAQFIFLPEVALSRRFEDGPLSGLTLAANALARVRPEERVLLNTPFSHELVGRAGVGYRLHNLVSIPVELDVSTSIGTPLLAPFAGENSTGAEVMGGAKVDVLTLPAAAGAGDGFIVQVFGGVATGGFGAGTPLGRVFLGVRGEKPADIDRDDDWIPDNVDRCPDDAEDKDGFEDTDGCPDTDNDGDNVPDVVDECPDVAEDHDGFEDDDGCPDVDNDGDGVLDVDDECKNVKGPAENKGCPWPDTDGDGIFDKDDACVDVKGVAALAGCPDADGDGITDAEDACPNLAGPKEPYDGCPDTDGDGITDDKDLCPNEPETINNVDDEDGCPDEGKVLVSLTKEKIEILDKIFFDTGKATIQAKSFPLLDQVATVMRSHREIAHVRVEGHTDDQGPDDKNLLLSQARADAVMQYLIDKGIVAERLKAEGFGESRPAAEGNSAAAREQNRRVEFVIVH
jgi:outer membrane protein OmpA-like peptidoglycan-associated protein